VSKDSTEHQRLDASWRRPTPLSAKGGRSSVGLVAVSEDSTYHQRLDASWWRPTPLSAMHFRRPRKCLKQSADVRVPRGMSAASSSLVRAPWNVRSVLSASPASAARLALRGPTLVGGCFLQAAWRATGCVLSSEPGYQWKTKRQNKP
jgi:hypothetical protein